ncbi:MAG: molybdopterin-binding protein [Planctomycetota bacterium]
MAESSSKIRAEIVAIGDELTTGVRLDTNSQWISQQLGHLGVTVAFHSTVGDDICDIVHVLKLAAQRCDIVVTTGGLGPTADDLTRQAIAKLDDVDLVLDESILESLRQRYLSRGREMPPNNEIQAWFPQGSKIITNPEGTAAGIEYHQVSTEATVFAFPGVPVELKQMWNQSVGPKIKSTLGTESVLHHYTLHCFGAGESQIEMMLPGMIERGRDPQVGITASAATISLRISTRAKTIDACKIRMQPTVDAIQKSLGNLIFGYDGQQLEEVVVDALAVKNLKLRLIDFGTHQAVLNQLIKADPDQRYVEAIDQCAFAFNDMENLVQQFSTANPSTADPQTILVVVSPINRDVDAVDRGNSKFQVGLSSSEGIQIEEMRFGGHSGWREIRAVKQVLNFIRLNLRPFNAEGQQRNEQN